MLSIIFFFCIIILVIQMEYKITSYNESDTAYLAENIESEKFGEYQYNFLRLYYKNK